MYDALLPHLKANPSARLLQNPAAFADASAGIAQIMVRMRPKNTETDVAMSERMQEAVAILAPGAANGIIAEIIQDPSSVEIRHIKRSLGHEGPTNLEDDA
jgi:hypothetical protein